MSCFHRIAFTYWWSGVSKVTRLGSLVRSLISEGLAERFEVGWRCAELHRLRGVFLATLGDDETQIEASFCEAIRIAREQKSVSLEKRAEATYAEYRRQKASGSGGRGFRLPLW